MGPWTEHLHTLNTTRKAEGGGMDQDSLHGEKGLPNKMKAGNILKRVSHKRVFTRAQKKMFRTESEKSSSKYGFDLFWG